MQVLEYSFNPNLDKDIKLRTFRFCPDHASKNHLGDLYIVAEEINYLPIDANLLEELANIIQEEFYSNPKRMPEFSFKDALRQGNSFLAKKAESGNVSWLGNLNIAVLNLGGFFLNFSKSGTTRILLLRSGELTDIGQETESHGIGLPSKFFANISSGRLTPNDKVLVFTQQLFESLYDDVLSEIINLEEINDRNIKRIISSWKKEARDWSGILLIAIAKKNGMPFLMPFKLFTKNKLIILLISLIILLLISFFIFQNNF